VVPAANLGFEIKVKPGDATIERGTSLLITAQFGKLLPAKVALHAHDSKGNTRKVQMARSLDDPLFGGRIESVAADLEYHVTYSGKKAGPFHITVFDFPQLVRSDAKLTYPKYTQLDDALIEDTRHITAVEGTKLTVLCHLNKQVTSAILVPRDGDAISLDSLTDQPKVYAATWILKKSRKFRLKLVDEAGRENRYPPEIVVHVTKNNPPDLKLVFPSRDLRVSPLEELDLGAKVWDDFGLNAWGLTYTLAGQKPKQIVLGNKSKAQQRQDVQFQLAMEQLEAKPDQLVSYHFWAEDIAANGKARRTLSDMYFAEVRPFEEIFRQGEQPPSQQQQQKKKNPQMQQIEELLKSQKEIINATWKIIRRETDETASDKFASDLELLVKSQQALKEKVGGLKQKLKDEQSIKHVDEVVEHVDKAAVLLGQAAQKLAPLELYPALAKEQSAYQALLKLRAREHMVIQAQQQQGQAKQQQKSSPRSQQQLQQLQLKKDQNRYQERQQARKPQDPAQAENRQVLSRLRELARRQQDINQKLKEMQNALEEAKTQEEKDEILRQLKRLREQQQRMLRDVDELKNRMEQKQNQQQMAESKKQVEQVRNQTRRASEALQKGMTPKALAEGTRAQRQLEQLRNEFQKKTAGAFSEQLKQMREDARQLAKDQEDLGKKVAEIDKPKKKKSLRDTGQRKKLVEGLSQQEENLEDLLKQMRKVVEQSEQSQPALARQLYDTSRQAHQDRIDQALKGSSQLLDKGFVDESKRLEKHARKGIDQLKKGVEKAADSVLGDRAEALRRAADELDQLAKQLGNEADRLDPSGKRQSDNQQAQKGNQDQQKGRQKGQQQQGQQKGDQRQASSQQKGQQQGQQQGRQSGKQQGQQQGQPNQRVARAGNQQQQQGQQPRQQKGQQPGQQKGQQSTQRRSQAQQQGQQPGQQKGQQKSQQQGQSSNTQRQSKSQRQGQQQGQQPGQQKGQQQGQQPGQQKGQQQGQQPGQQKGQQQGQQPGQQKGQQQGQQPGQQKGQQQGQQPGQQKGQQPGQRQASNQPNPSSRRNFFEDAKNGTARGGGGHAPITGEDFRQWSDRLRNVEELLDSEQLRREASKIRNKATDAN